MSMCHSFLCILELLSTSLARRNGVSPSHMSLLLQNALPQHLHIPLRGFDSLGVSECRFDVVHLCVIQNPAYGHSGRAGDHPGRIAGCEPMPFTLKPAWTFSVGVPGHLWTLVFVLSLYSSFVRCFCRNFL